MGRLGWRWRGRWSSSVVWRVVVIWIRNFDLDWVAIGFYSLSRASLCLSLSLGYHRMEENVRKK